MSPSVISRHRKDFSHKIDWENIEILDRERSYNKRLISEMFFINRQKNGLNLQSDTEFLPNEYLPLLSLFPNV